MKKHISFLLSALLLIAIVFSASTTFAMETDNFTQMTPQEQYEYLQTLESDEDVQKALDALSPEQLKALDAYKQSLEQKKDKDTVGFADMTPEDQFNYLNALESKDEIDAALKLLSKEQFAALENYASSLTPDDEEKSKEKQNPAINYTKTGPFKPPVNIGAMTKSGLSAARALTASEEEDALVLTKTVNDLDDMITIESYATGEVTITSGEPIPADIIMVLDTSGSMDEDINTEEMVSISFSNNKKANNFENNNDLFVKVDNLYWPVTITRTWSWYWTYTYSYTANGVPTIKTSKYNTGSPPNWAFYRYGTTERIAALKKAANNFIDAVKDKANLTSEGVDHRIAVVTFASGSSIISGNNVPNDAFVDAHNNTGGIDSLKGTINSLSANGATRADLGMNKAVQIFENDLPDTSGQRNRVVIFFTDGTPTSYDTFDPAVANGAISHAKTLKQDVSASPAGYGATVYSIGIFDGADPTAPINSSSTSKENKFMHFVSSNYPNATSMSNPGSGGNDGYYLSASTGGALDDIFQNISDDIVTGGTTVTLDESSVIKDILTSYFELDTTKDINIYTSEVDNATGVWQTPVTFADGIATVSPDGKTISISGFDYADNYYAEIIEDGVITGYRGKKLIVEIPIRYIDGSCFGGTVPTNEPESGIYDGDTLIEALPIPTVDIPVCYNFTELNRSIYITQSLTLSDLFAFNPSYIVSGVNNKYVNIVYTVEKPDGTPLGTYTILAGDTSGAWNPSNLTLTDVNSNTTYTVSCTVTPVCGPVLPVTIDKDSSVYVFKPSVTYQDSIIYLGETPNYSNNFVSQEWKNSVVTAPTPSGTPPTLSYTYSPAEGAFGVDTHVQVDVSIGGEDITNHVTFIHESCGEPGCGFNPSLGQFMVHVKTCSLTITKTGATDSTDTFIFEVFGTVGDNDVTIIVSMQGNTSRTIIGLPVGNYTVTEKDDWSWRYTASSQSTTLGYTNPNAEVVINNNRTNNKWLDGDSWIANIFSGCGTEEYN